MTECERAEFLESLGADTAKLCDQCNLTALLKVDRSHQACIALEEIKYRKAAFERGVKKVKAFPGIDDLSKIVNTKTFTFEVRTTMGHYAIVSPTYANASEMVRNETREPVLSVRKCSE